MRRRGLGFLWASRRGVRDVAGHRWVGAQVVAVLALDDPTQDAAPFEALQNIACDGCVHDLPLALKTVDRDERDIVDLMRQSRAPVHLISALAGCGKPTLLQRIVSAHCPARASRVKPMPARSA